jgi:hypothetical protein
MNPLRIPMPFSASPLVFFIPSPATTAKLLGIITAGGFGGWIYAIVSLLEAGKQTNGWTAARGCSVRMYMAGQAIVGVGGAFAALFAILTLGNTAHATTSSDLADTPIYFAALCVVGGFIGNRLLVGVGEKMARQLTDLEKKSAKAMDTALEAESKAENATNLAIEAKDMLLSTWVARDLAEQLEKAKEMNQIPPGLIAEATTALSKLSEYVKVFPTTRILFIVSANLKFALNQAADAVKELRKFLENRQKAGIPRDDDDVSAWYNISCYFSVLSVKDPKSMGYEESETPTSLKLHALAALKECLEIAKQCGPKLLNQRLEKIKTDPDLAPLRESADLKDLIGRYGTGN